MLCNFHMFTPEMAERDGVTNAIVCQQLAFLCGNFGKDINGEKWYKASIEDLQKREFKYLSEKTIRMAIKYLKSKGYIKVKQFDKKQHDKTNWYCVDVNEVNK